MTLFCKVLSRYCLWFCFCNFIDYLLTITSLTFWYPTNSLYSFILQLGLFTAQERCIAISLCLSLFILLLAIAIWYFCYRYNSDVLQSPVSLSLLLHFNFYPVFIIKYLIISSLLKYWHIDTCNSNKLLTLMVHLNIWLWDTTHSLRI